MWQGIQVVRRDVCPFVQRTYKATLEAVLRDRGFDAARELVLTAAARLLRGEVELADLIVTKALRGDYKSDKLPHVTVANKLEARGGTAARPRNGDRVPFVYLPRDSLPKPRAGAPELTTSDFAEDPAFVAERGLTPDYMWYLEHSLESCVVQLFELEAGASTKRSKLMFQEVKLRSRNFRMIGDFFKRPRKA